MFSNGEILHYNFNILHPPDIINNQLPTQYPVNGAAQMVCNLDVVAWREPLQKTEITDFIEPASSAEMFTIIIALG